MKETLNHNANKIIISSFYDEDNKLVTYTVEKCLKLIKENQINALTQIIFHRLFDRYIKIFLFNDKEFKKMYLHGFTIMANSCLLIETLYAFYKGNNETESPNENAFKWFFESHKDFKDFIELSKDFYKNVRCGILHQAETKNGWLINRTDPKLINKSLKSINAELFLGKLNDAIIIYKEKLTNSDWDSELWDNARRKIRFIIDNTIKKN